MNTIEVILTRRSIRKYTDEKITDDHINLLVKAAMYAPTARNFQPCRFIVVKERTNLDRLAELLQHGKMLKQAAAAILISGDITAEPTESYLVQGCAAATQNILLAAHSIGLGAVWLGIYPREQRIKDVSTFFNLPKAIIPVSIVSVGYPNEVRTQPERFNEENIHYEKW